MGAERIMLRKYQFLPIYVMMNYFTLEHEYFSNQK